MQKVTYYKRLDMQKRGAQWSINAKLNDSGSRCLVISITDGGRSFYLTESCSAKIYGLKPDGTKIYNDCVIEDGKCIYNITSQTVSCIGMVKCELSISDDGQHITTSEFNIDVEDVLADENAIESSDEFNALTIATNEANNATVEAKASASRANEIAEDVENKLANGEFVGSQGLSSYELAVQQGFEGTLDEYLESLKAKLDDKSVTAEKLADNSVTTEKISKKSIKTEHLQEELVKQIKDSFNYKKLINTPRSILDVSDGLDVFTLKNGAYDIYGECTIGNNDIYIRQGNILIKDDLSLNIISEMGAYFIADISDESIEWSTCFCITDVEMSNYLKEYTKTKDLPKGLQIAVVLNDDEAMAKLGEIQENFTKITPFLFLSGYDSFNTLGIRQNCGMVIIDSGDGNIENALIVPCAISEIPYTIPIDEAVKKCIELQENIVSYTIWKDTSKYPIETLLPRHVKANMYVSGYNNTIDQFSNIFVIELSNCKIGLSTKTFKSILVENEEIKFDIEISESYDQWIYTVIGDTSKGQIIYKGVANKSDKGNANGTSKFEITCKMPYQANLIYTYGKKI